MEAEVGALSGPVEFHGLCSIAKIVGLTESGWRLFTEIQKRIEHTLQCDHENTTLLSIVVIVVLWVVKDLEDTLLSTYLLKRRL